MILCFFCQLYVKARDLGEPLPLDSTQDAIVDVTVKHNLYDPEFARPEYETSLPVDSQTNRVVFTVTAVDRDEVCGNQLISQAYTIVKILCIHTC